MFWVFDRSHVNDGVIRHLRSASPNGQLVRISLSTDALTDEQIDGKVRVSAINGGGSNGACARGRVTYRHISEWTEGWPPKEIGLQDGVSASLCSELAAAGGIVLDSV
jgi:hypothetical protein